MEECITELPVEAALPLFLLAGVVAFFTAAELAFRHGTECALRDLEAAFRKRITALRRDASLAPAAARLEEIGEEFRSILARHGLADPSPPRRVRSNPPPQTPPPARSC